MKIKRDRENIEGEENGPLPKRKRKGGYSLSTMFHGGNGFTHLRLFYVRKLVFNG